MKNTIAMILAAVVTTTATSAGTLVTSDVVSNTTWGGGANPSPIILDTTIHVTSGATLTILPGTIVRGNPRSASGAAGAPGSLIVTKDGRINAAANPANEIIFTTAALDADGNGLPDDSNSDGFYDQATAATPDSDFYDEDPRDTPLPVINTAGVVDPAAANTGSNTSLWGGLIILGNAPTNLGTGNGSSTDNPQAKLGQIEGLTANALSEYGGDYPNDNSGILRYVSVRHGGDVVGTANEINGITMGGVGAGTCIEFCEVYSTFDDGFEWFGGTVNTNNLVANSAGDDQFDGDQGWTGQNQFWVAVMPKDGVGDSGGDASFEFDGVDGDLNLDFSGVATPFPQYDVYNATVVGSDDATGRSFATNPANGYFNLKADYSGKIYNTIVVNVDIPTEASAVLQDPTNPIIIAHSTFDDVNAGTGATPAVVAGPSNVVNNFGFSGLVGENCALPGGVNLRPTQGFTGTFDALSGLDVPKGIEPVAYRGAVDPGVAIGDAWVADWTVLSESGISVD